jgi:hypothetical protein
MVRVPSAEVVGWRPTSPSLCLSVTPVLHHRGPLIAGHNFLFTIAFLSDTAIAFDTTNLGKYLFHGHGDTKKISKTRKQKIRPVHTHLLFRRLRPPSPHILDPLRYFQLVASDGACDSIPCILFLRYLFRLSGRDEYFLRPLFSFFSVRPPMMYRTCSDIAT